MYAPNSIAACVFAEVGVPGTSDLALTYRSRSGRHAIGPVHDFDRQLAEAFEGVLLLPATY